MSSLRLVDAVPAVTAPTRPDADPDNQELRPAAKPTGHLDEMLGAQI